MATSPPVPPASSSSESDEHRVHVRPNKPQLWDPSKPKIPIVIAGHSMIRRLKEFVGQNTNLSMEFADIEWVCRGGWTLDRFEKDKRYGLEEVIRLAPDLVYLEFGTNELDSDEEEDVIGVRAMNIIDRLLESGVKRVILAHVLPRKKSTVPLWIFNQKVRVYNNYMAERLRNLEVKRKSSPHFYKDQRKWWWEHMRMRSSKYSVTRPDGVHISDKHLPTYYTSVRNALLVGSKDLH